MAKTCKRGEKVMARDTKFYGALTGIFSGLFVLFIGSALLTIMRGNSIDNNTIQYLKFSFESAGGSFLLSILFGSLFTRTKTVQTALISIVSKIAHLDREPVLLKFQKKIVYALKARTIWRRNNYRRLEL